jgi:hypothetical protein
MQTTAPCLAGDGDVNLLEKYVAVSYKTQRNVIERTPITVDEEGNPSVDLSDVEAMEEAEDSGSYYMGTRFGVGELGVCHNFGCVADYFDEIRDDELKIKYRRPDDEKDLLGNAAQRGEAE